MNAETIVKHLRLCAQNGDCYKCEIDNVCDPNKLLTSAADLIEFLQAQLKLEHDGALVATENYLRLQSEINDLQAQLAKEKCRAEKAVADLKYIAICETCKKSGITEYPEIAVIQCEYYDSECGCGKYEWRGAEEGD